MELLIGGGNSLFYDNTDSAQLVKIERSSALYIFENSSIITPRIDDNALGMYTFIPTGTDGEAVFGSFDTPEFSLRPGKNSCIWDPPSNSMKFGIQKIPTCPINMQAEICIDVLWKGCWQKLLGLGNGKTDWDASQGSAAFLARAIQKKMQGIGNDFYYLMQMGGHPYIEKSYQNKWYRLCGVQDDHFENFYKMMQSCGGILTMADALKHVDKLDNMNVEIPDNWISKDGATFIGDAMLLIERLKNASSEKFALYDKQTTSESMALVGSANPGGLPIIKVTPSIFDRLKKQIMNEYKTIPEAFYMRILGESYGCSTCVPRQLKGTLMFDGCIIKCMYEWRKFDKMLGIHTHRAMMCAPGVFGIAYDVLPSEDNNYGIEITKWKINPYKGKTFFSGDFRAGATILDTDFITMACKVRTPGQAA